jgi:RNA polymerase sigma factor (sigma-70 family)
VLRRAEQEVSFSDMPFDTLLRIGMSDDYPSSHYVFETQGHQISIADERLGEALSQIESAGRNLLLLAYFLDLNDREIGALLGIPRSTIQRRRQRFLDQMKQLLKE